MVNRINGFAGTGLDIDSIVAKLMKAERIPVDKMNQKQQINQWQQDAYRDMNSLLLDFRNTLFTMKLQSTFQANKAYSTNDSIVSVSATSAANAGNYSLKINNLASSATLTSNDVTPVSGSNPTGAGSASTTLASLGIASNSSLTISGATGTTTIAVDPTGAGTISTLVDTVNAQSNVTGVKLNYDANIDRLFFVSSTTGAASKVKLSSTNSSLLGQLGINSSNSFNANTDTITATGAATFSSLNSVIDTTLVSPRTLTINDGTTNYNFSIDATTTIGNLINNINNSTLGQTGFTASLNGAGKLAFANPNAANSYSFSDFGGATSLGLDTATSVSAAAPSGLKGATFNGTGVSVFGSTSQLINSTLTAPQTLRISEGANNYDFVVDSSTTIGSLLNNINSSAFGKTGASAYLNSSGQIAFVNPDDSKTYTFSDQTADSTDIVAAVGLDSTSAPVTGIVYNKANNTGQDASVIFNGAAVNYASNTFSINGMTFTAKNTSTSNVGISVTQDVDSVFNSIKGFVDKYNELIDKINTKTSEQKYRDYKPLSADQKTAMKDADIKAWEDKAKSGLLRNDSMLTTALDNFRSTLNSPVTGLNAASINQLAQIGITTGDYTEHGKLNIDETKLRAAIAQNPTQVSDLFTVTDNVPGNKAGHGLASQLYDQATASMADITTKAGTVSSLLNSYQLGNQLLELNTQVSDKERSLTDIETRYYKQFSAMEQAINTMNAQSASLMSQLGGK